jgi:hypothetical protein
MLQARRVSQVFAGSNGQGERSIKKWVLLALMSGVIASSSGCKKPHPGSGGGPDPGTGSGALVVPSPPPAPDPHVKVSVSDLAPYFDGDTVWLRYTVAARRHIDQGILEIEGRCHSDGRTYLDNITTELSDLDKGDSEHKDESFLNNTMMLASTPDWCQFEVGFNDDPVDSDAFAPVETDCWSGDKVTSGACPDSTKALAAVGDGLVGITGEAPSIDLGEPGIDFDVTANQPIKGGAVSLKVRCNDGQKTYEDEEEDDNELVPMRPGDTMHSALGSDLKLDANPAWCEYSFLYKKDISDVSGNNVETLCWKGGTNTSKGPCS